MSPSRKMNDILPKTTKMNIAKECERTVNMSPSRKRNI